MNNLRKSIIFTLVSLIVLSYLFTSFETRFSWTPAGSDTQTFIADYEYQALSFLNNNSTLAGARVVSDPLTMRIFTSLGNRDALLEHSMNTIFFTPEGQAVVSDIRNQILSQSDSKNVYTEIMKLNNTVPYDEKGYINLKGGVPDQGFIVVFSARTQYWLDKTNGIEIPSVFFPFSYKVNANHMFQFLDTRYFQLLYKVDQEIYVYFVRPQPYYQATPCLQYTQLNFDNLKLGSGTHAFNFSLTSENQTTITDHQNGTYLKWAIVHNYLQSQNLSDYDFLIVNFKGQNTNATFRISIDGPTTSDRSIFLFKDDSRDYKTVLLDLRTPYTKEQSPSLSNVTRIMLTPHLDADVHAGTYYVSVSLVKYLSAP